MIILKWIIKKMAKFGLDSFASRGVRVAGSYEYGYETSIFKEAENTLIMYKRQLSP
jgi:hypothetical protein